MSGITVCNNGSTAQAAMIAAESDTRGTGLSENLSWLFRVAVCMEFIGHGAFGVMTKAAWVPYFGVVGMPEAWAWRLMPIVGWIDITLGVIGLLSPRRAVLGWMAFWGLWTASLRPLAGQGMWELPERAGNYGVPLAFLMLAGRPQRLSDWLSPIRAFDVSQDRLAKIAFVLRVTTATLLIGHGGCGAILQKSMFASHYSAIGLSSLTVEMTSLITGIGWFEIALGTLILLRPRDELLWFALVWKIATELLFSLSGAPIWEFIERGGSYAAPLALIMVGNWRQRMSEKQIQLVTKE
ncbi:MAG: hypothetical protein IAG10_35610 [Planctomycetaceae bacterium]|nr:hypothetical protein [Planctomycetaceae bacterium]